MEILFRNFACLFFRYYVFVVNKKEFYKNYLGVDIDDAVVLFVKVDHFDLVFYAYPCALLNHK